MSRAEFMPKIKTYDSFLQALVWSHSTTNPNPAFPEYQKQIDNLDDGQSPQIIDTLYIKHFLSTMTNIQDGLLKYIKAVAKCARYGRDDYSRDNSMFISHIKMFIERGASIKECTKYLMRTLDPKYLEDLSTHIEMKMPLLDAFWDELDQDYIRSLTDWPSIKPAHWETIVYGHDIDGSSLTPEERANESLWFYMYMKYLSDKLKTL